MIQNSNRYTQRDWDLMTLLFLFALHKITPSMRYIYFELNNEKSGVFLCYFDKEPTDIEKDLIDDIGTNIIASDEYITDVDYKFFISNEPLDMLNKGQFCVYARYEKP